MRPNSRDQTLARLVRILTLRLAMLTATWLLHKRKAVVARKLLCALQLWPPREVSRASNSLAKKITQNSIPVSTVVDWCLHCQRYQSCHSFQKDSPVEFYAPVVQ